MNDESSFDPAQFLDATTTEALVRRPPLPVGEYLGIVGEPKTRAWASNKPDAKTKSGIAVDIPVVIDLAAYPNEQALLGGLSQVQLTTGVFLDLNEGKMIDWSVGKNGSLRRWREALGMNNPGEPFSIRQMQGRPIRVKVKHEAYEGEMYDKIDSVAKA
jgi:hypothetical protein